MSALAIREGKLEDLPTLNYISRASKQHWGYPDEWIEHWREALQVTEVDVRRGRVVVAVVGDAIVGFSKVLDTMEHFEIDHLFIHPDQIGKGYGHELLSAVLSACGDEKDIIVVSDPHSVGFYEKMGFEIYDRVESYPPGRFLPVMKYQRPTDR